MNLRDYFADSAALLNRAGDTVAPDIMDAVRPDGA
jgi:hypothetical protein